MAAHLTAEQRQLALRLKVRGLSLREIGPQVGCSHQGGVLYPDRRPARGRRPPRCRGRWPPLAAEPTSAPSSGPGGPRPRSWPVLGWPPRSVAGWPNGGRRQELSARSRIQFPGDPMMWVSHQSIYQACTCRAAASCAGSWPRCRRTGRAKRRPRGRGEHTGQLRDLVMISQRAAEADDRAVPGHWEGDRADRSLRLLA
jgi:hypothetical protein